MSNYHNRVDRVAVITSGYFDPVHSGHLDYLFQAATYGDLYVIVNNDKQAVLKKGKSFLPQQERFRVIAALRCVKGAWLSKSTDPTVRSDLPEVVKLLKDDGYTHIIFAKGGDRKSDNTPEKETCHSLDVPILWGIGGDKFQASSEFLKEWVAFATREKPRVKLTVNRENTNG